MSSTYIPKIAKIHNLWFTNDNRNSAEEKVNAICYEKPIIDVKVTVFGARLLYTLVEMR